MKFRCFLFVLSVLVEAAAVGQAFTEYPGAVTPIQIASGPDGNLWFTEFSRFGNAIGRITLTGEITRFPIPTIRALPVGITAGPDGNVWFTESEANKIGRITPTGEITEFPLPVAGRLPGMITAGPDQNLWFTDGRSIWRVTTAGAFTEFPLPGSGFGGGAITTGPDGNLWFAGSSAHKIGRITLAGVVTEFPLPVFSYPFGIAAGSDGALWFTESGFPGKIGRITTSGTITEFPVPTVRGLESTPSIVAGLDGNLYFAEPGASQIGRITTSGVITEFPLPTPGYFEGLALGPDGAIWIAEYEAGQIGRMSTGAPATCEVDATTMCLNGGRFNVTAAWRRPDGTTGSGEAVRLTADSGYFWFFDPANIEAVVKVLNACSVNGHYWLFGAGLTNVEVTLRVVDTFSGSAKTYVNPLGTAYQPVQDTSAFETCP